MKKLNLVPVDIKKQRTIAKYKRIGLMALIVPVFIVANTGLTVNSLSSEKEELEAEIANAKKIQSIITSENNKNQNYLIMKSNLEKESLPINKFLLFLSIEMPDEIQLHSITSESIIERARIEALIESGQIDKKKKEETVEADGEKEEEAFEEKLISKDEDNKLIVKGASLTVDSIGELMKEMEKTEFIEKVDIRDVQNYYNGAYSYKLFELVLEIKK